MLSGEKLRDMEYKRDVAIPTLEKMLSDSSKTPSERLELYRVYVETLRVVARDDFASFNKYLELDDDHNRKESAFYHHRKNHLGELFKDLNDMEIYDKYDYMLISMPPRVGKEQPLSSGILTPTGWSTMGDMRVGSKIIGSDGQSHNVTGVFPQGIKDVYTVTFDDGTTVECGLEHLWTVKTRDDRRRGGERTVTTGDMMKNLYVENGSRKNYSVNYVKPIEYANGCELPLAPYLLGALIGDGGLTNGIRLTNVDQELLDNVELLLPETDVLKQISDGINYSITKRVDVRNSMGYPEKCRTQQYIDSIGLNVRSDSKFIPDCYKTANSSDRLELLRGLMDTDGYCGDNSYNEYVTVSRVLANDVVHLIRSLGGRATVVEKPTKCKLAYRVQFNMELNPFGISRKADKFTPRSTRKYKYITSIEKTGSEECQCIMVDAPDHLYVTDGYNLTHNTTTGIRFMAWIIARHPLLSQLATSYSDNITMSFYIGVLEVINHERFGEMFPECPLVNQNAKREEIWLQKERRYPSISFVPISGSMTGRSEASRYLYCDDMVSGIEEALSVARLETLWSKYTVNASQRKLEGCKEIHIATNWSVHDPMSRLKREHADNPRCKILDLACFDENGESNFQFNGGFSTDYYLDKKNVMDSASFSALYMQEPIEREGILYHQEDLQYYFELPKERPDTIIAVADSKNLGKDYVASPIGYVYNDLVYVEDVVFNNGLPAVTKPLVADAFIRHKVVRADVELNNGGNYYAEGVKEILSENGADTSMRMFFSANNKDVKIITYSDFVKSHFVFKDSSQYSSNSEYAKFMKSLLTWSQSGKNAFDDAPDSIAMLAQLYQDLTGRSVKVLNRRELGM